jgi:hypothetical protein
MPDFWHVILSLSTFQHFLYISHLFHSATFLAKKMRALRYVGTFSLHLTGSEVAQMELKHSLLFIVSFRLFYSVSPIAICLQLHNLIIAL